MVSNGGQKVPRLLSDVKHQEVGSALAHACPSPFALCLLRQIQSQSGERCKRQNRVAKFVKFQRLQPVLNPMCGIILVPLYQEMRK